MRTEETSGHSVAFTAINSEGEKFTELDCPSRVTREIHKAVSRHRLTGSVYSGGSRWDWRCGAPDDVMLEFTRGGEVEDSIPIPRTGWMAFEHYAQRRGLDPREWLTAILRRGLANGLKIRTMIVWLFPQKEESPSEECQRFESLQREFHGKEAAV